MLLKFIESISSQLGVNITEQEIVPTEVDFDDSPINEAVTYVAAQVLTSLGATQIRID